eukprot:scaffold5498_cov86-Cylindrotheca_fusiformis.AAC.7
MVSASEVLLQYVCPAVGVVLANCMFFAPYGDVKKAIAKGQLGNLNPTPWAFMLGNCFGWIFYAILKEDMWVFAGNVPGFLLSVWLNLGAVKLLQQEHYSTELRTTMANYPILHGQQVNSSQRGSIPTTIVQSQTADKSDPSAGTKPPFPTVEKDGTTASVRSDDFMMKPKKEDWLTILWDVTSQQMTPAPTRHENLILALLVVWTIVGSVIALVKDESIMSNETAQLMVGVLTNVILVFFYGAPLSTIRTILQDRNTASLHVPTMMLNTMSSTFWMVYGIAVMDYFLILPNGLGACLGGIQIILCFIFPRGTIATATSVANVHDDHVSCSSSNGTEILFMEPPGTLEAPTITPIATNQEAPFATIRDGANDNAHDDRISYGISSSNGAEVMLTKPPETPDPPLAIAPITTDEEAPFVVEQEPTLEDPLTTVPMATDEEAQIVGEEKPQYQLLASSIGHLT